MKCTNCNTQLPPNAKFCPECGRPAPTGANIEVRQDIGTVQGGEVVGAMLGDGTLPGGLKSTTTQKVETVEEGGAVVGTVVGEHAQVGGQRQYGDVVHGHKVAGGIHAGRDVIVGDQYNDLRQQAVQVATPAEFVTALQSLHAQVAALRQQSALSQAQVAEVTVAEENVQEALEEAQKPQPVAARIKATLTGAKAILDPLAKSVKSAVGLGTVAASLIQLALKLFGG
ncbi:MAG: zinc ribbon domain-containing protein [Chloroflexi bacterium]|nr:zinc ribbon domain-containing protein [Chloroflexota bacterium]